MKYIFKQPKIYDKFRDTHLMKKRQLRQIVSNWLANLQNIPFVKQRNTDTFVLQQLYYL